MPFKIVQTIENDRIVLTIVPSNWEQSGSLFWPCHRNEVKLIHDAESVPKPDWKRIQCVKKREYSTLHEAEQELSIMQQASDTDAEASNKCNSKQRSRPLHKTHVLQPIDLNDQIIFTQTQNKVATVQASSDQKYVSVEKNIEPVVITINAEPSTFNSPVTFLNSLDTNASESNSFPSVRSPASETYVSVTQNEVYAQILQNQEKILSQIASLQASVDFLMGTNLIKPKEQPLVRLPIQPVNSKNDLDELESKLKDQIIYDKLVSDLTFICGKSGKCKGVDSCYKLVDYFFTRQIFLQCNWTGSTRDENAQKKIPFKYYHMVRNCFFDIIRKSDSTFTENDADKFFKVIIKNAKARLQNKVNSVARASKPRVKKQVDGCNIEKLQENGKSSPPQQVSNEEAMNAPLQNYENAADYLNGEGNEKEALQNNKRDENA